MEATVKTGLVLEGGAMRGLFTSGCLDVFIENNITFDMTTGVSAGAAFGCNFKSRQTGRALRYNLKYARDKRYSSWQSFLKTGNLFNAEFCYHTLPEKLDPFDFETYRNNPMEFFAVTTDILRGTPRYHKLSSCNYEELELMRASASMPLVSVPVKAEGTLLLDGGITDSIPLKFSEGAGCKKNVVILTQPENYRKKPSKLSAVMNIALRKYPELIKAIKNRPAMYNAQTEYAFQAQKEGRALVICPETSLGISRTCKNESELKRVYKEGRKAAEKNLNRIKDFLSAS
ncbi:patatin family protein [Treponema rectale]|uniref:Patatin family protein n=1 Tax=Treponema rectale TaxID=744512 RepID=A0A840SIS6_9SPIR|nr:patatin family protein [Treponema rectale]MBB5220068.1 putative patatin/cPLA2 family phospholipase [Treponema rectale]QOS40620.1 patatin family protein [Treponema rectale]